MCIRDRYYGVITSITKDGLNISFGKDVFGFLPRMFMGYEANVMQDFMQGQLVSANVACLYSMCILLYAICNYTELFESSYIRLY